MDEDEDDDEDKDEDEGDGEDGLNRYCKTATGGADAAAAVVVVFFFLREWLVWPFAAVGRGSDRGGEIAGGWGTSRTISLSPGSVMERHDTRKYRPQAVPNSTLLPV